MLHLKNNQIKSRFSFPVTLTTDEVDGAYTVTFRDLPEAITQGENIEDAVNEATDCLEEAIANRVIRRLEIPVPSELANNEYLVTIPLQTFFKASIWLAIITRFTISATGIIASAEDTINNYEFNRY